MFSKNLKKIRESKNIGINELGRLTGLSPSYLSALEKGKKTNPSRETIEKIANALEVLEERLTGEAASSIIEDRIKKLGMTLEEVAEKANVPLDWLQNLDAFIPGQADIDDFLDPKELDELEQDQTIGEYKSYYWITKVAEVLGLPGSRLRAALARQEIPFHILQRAINEEAIREYQELPEFDPDEFQKNFQSGIDFYIKIKNLCKDNNFKNYIKIPILSKIPAGIAVEAVQDVVGQVDIPKDWVVGGRNYFGFLVKGDSMYPEYLDGDILIVRKQDTCESGDDCIVVVNNSDATLKRVNIFPDGIELEAINPMYGKRKYTNKELKNLPIKILGVVVELRRKKKLNP